MVAQDQILTPAYKIERRHIEQQVFAGYSPAAIEAIKSIILMQYKSILVDPEVVDLISYANSKQIKVLALTNGYTGRFGKIDSLENLRISKLKVLGIDFSSNFPEIPLLSFKHLQELNNAPCVPMFKAGIIFTCRQPKGEVLEAFLPYEKRPIQKIIFVDNRLKNLLSVESFCIKNNIEFQGFLYTAIELRSKLPLNQPLTDYQFKILVQKQCWLNDQEIQLLLQQK